jgi:hypothetical protein
MIGILRACNSGSENYYQTRTNQYPNELSHGKGFHSTENRQFAWDGRANHYSVKVLNRALPLNSTPIYVLPTYSSRQEEMNRENPCRKKRE